MPRDDQNAAPGLAAVPEETGATGLFPWRQTFAALRHRNYRLFFFGQMISLVGTWMENTAQSWLVYQLTGSKLMLGTVAAVGSAPLLLFSTWGGSVADRHSKRTVLLWTQSGMMLLAFVFAGLIWSGQVRPWHVLVLAALGGVAMAFDIPARQAFVVEIAGREDLLNAVSLNSSLFNGARVVGPAVAGYLIAQVGMAMCFFLNGISFLAVLAGLMLMRLPAFVPPAAPESTWQHALEGFAYVAKHRQVRTLLLLVAIVGVFGWSYSVLLPAFATDVLRVGSREYGMLLSSNGVGAFCGALVVATYGRRLPLPRMIFGGLGFFALMLLLLAATQNYYVALVFMGGAGWGMLLYLSTSNTVVQTSVADGMRGRVMGIWTLMFGGMMPVGGLAAGVLSHWLGVPLTVAIGGATCGMAALVTCWLVRRSPFNPT